MTDEDRLIDLLQQHQAGDSSVEDAIFELVDTYFRRTIKPGLTRKFGEGVVGTADRVGQCPFTDMVEDFFLKVLDKKPDAFWKARTAIELRKWASVVIKHQMLDFLRRRKRGEKILAEIAPLVKQKQNYFEERFMMAFSDFLDILSKWESSGSKSLAEQAAVMRYHYVVGLTWSQVASQIEISDERLMKIREAATAQLKRLV